MPTTYPGQRLPGVGTEVSATPRRILLGGEPVYLPGGKIIDGSLSRDPLNTGDVDVLRAGLLMGKITTGGLYAPAILGKTTVAYVDNDVALTVGLPTAIEIVRRIGATGTFTVVGPATSAAVVSAATCTYSAVDVATGILTCADMNDDFIVGSLCLPNDGSQVPRAILAEEYGLKVTDENGVDIDIPFAKLLINGIVDTTMILNMPAAAETYLRAYILTSATTGLRLACPGIQFSDDF